MTTARKTPSGRGRRKRFPGWLLLLLGLGLGVGGVLVTQLFVQRAGSKDGLAGLFRARPEPAPKPAAAPAAAAKPKFEFYTLLPGESVVGERGARAAPSNPQAPAREPAARTNYVLQAASFATFEEADQLKARLALSGMVASIQKVTIEGRGEFHRVRLGPYRNLDELDAANQRLERMGFKALRLRVTEPAPQSSR